MPVAAQFLFACRAELPTSSHPSGHLHTAWAPPENLPASPPCVPIANCFRPTAAAEPPTPVPVQCACPTRPAVGHLLSPMSPLTFAHTHGHILQCWAKSFLPAPVCYSAINDPAVLRPSDGLPPAGFHAHSAAAAASSPPPREAYKSGLVLLRFLIPATAPQARFVQITAISSAR